VEELEHRSARAKGHERHREIERLAHQPAERGAVERLLDEWCNERGGDSPSERPRRASNSAGVMALMAVGT
jgi:hypothetical protein